MIFVILFSQAMMFSLYLEFSRQVRSHWNVLGVLEGKSTGRGRHSCCGQVTASQAATPITI